MSNGKDEPIRPALDALDDQAEMKALIHRRLVESLDLLEAQRMPADELRLECMRRVDALLSEQRRPLSTLERQRLVQEVMDEIFGLGPLEQLLRDMSITDILANGAQNVYIERNGRLEKTGVSFRNDAHLMQIIDRIGARIGRRIDEGCPMIDARLADGSRVNAIIPPLALDGPALSIRRFGATPINIDTLIQLRAIQPEMAMFLQACVKSRINIVISGGTGSGKTTLLNALSRWIPPEERVVTIEDAAELKLQREHVVRLETRPPNIEGKGEITQRGLLRNTLRMRPDRIVIGEVRGDEALDMLQAMNTGHEGSMTTVHANSSRDALRRIENMISMAGLNYPVHAIRQQMSSALNLVIHLARLTGGPRKLVAVSEITGMEGDTVCLQDIFRFNQTGVDSSGNAEGFFESCGVRPHLLSRLETKGIHLPADLFQRRRLG